MPGENGYSRVVKRYQDEELIHILHNRESYVDELLQAVIWECETRGIQDPLIQEITPTLHLPEPEPEELPAIDFPTEKPEIKKEPERIPFPLYSQTAILAFSVFFSTFLGGILFLINLSKIDRKALVPVGVFCVLFTVADAYVSLNFSSQTILPILMNIAGGLILSELLWNHYIGKGKSYRSKSVLLPLIITLVIMVPLLYYAYHVHPEWFSMSIADAPKK